MRICRDMVENNGQTSRVVRDCKISTRITWCSNGGKVTKNKEDEVKQEPTPKYREINVSGDIIYSFSID